MSDATIYSAKNKRDHMDRLLEIASLCKVGAAASNTLSDVEHPNAGFCAMFETIHRLAIEAFEIAEG